MAQDRCATSSGHDSAGHLHLKEGGHSFEDGQVRVLEREDRWFEWDVKEAVHVKLTRVVTLSITHIQRSPPLTGVKFRTFTLFDET